MPEPPLSKEPPSSQARPSSVLPLFRTERPGPAARPEVVAERHAVARADQGLVLLTSPTGRAAAKYRALRHRLLEHGDPKAVLVTSAHASEGTTTVASNLALAIAELRRYRVLLLEANLHRPSLAARFALPHNQHPCFFAQLEEHRSTPAAPWRVTEMGAGDLHLLAVGAVAAEARRIDAPSFAAALEAMRAHYEYVIVDAPPVLTGPDVNLLQDAADAIVLVARARHTRARALREAIEQISPADIAGVVVIAA